MAVSIIPKFKASDIQKNLEVKKKLIEQVILLRLQRIGETFVKNARENGTYNDITGNLRNSIGYVILKDGRQLVDNFQRSAKVKAVIKSGKNKGKEKVTSGSTDGVKKGKALAEEIASRYPRGFVLICVAGMEYAAAVESKGKDVLTASGKTAEKQLKAAIIEISKNIKAA
jgi:hypothetical protein